MLQNYNWFIVIKFFYSAVDMEQKMVKVREFIIVLFLPWFSGDMGKRNSIMNIIIKKYLTQMDLQSGSDKTVESLSTGTFRDFWIENGVFGANFLLKQRVYHNDGRTQDKKA